MNRKYGNNQNIYLSESNEVPSDPMYCVQMLMEEEEAWHNLEIAMIKAEHTAIVNEDTMLLEAADDDFKTKARKFFQDFGQQFLRYVDQVINKWTEVQLKIMSRTKKLDKLDKILETKMKTKINNTEQKRNRIDNLTCQIDKSALDLGMELASKQNEVIKIMNKFESGLTQRRREMDNDGSNAYNQSDDFKTNLKHISTYNSKNDADVSNLGDSLKNILSPQSANDADNDFRTYRTDKVKGETVTLDFKVEGNDTNNIGRTYARKIIKFARDDRKKAIDVLKNFRKTGTKILNIALSHTKNNDADSDEIKAAKRTITGFKQTCNDYIILINRATLNALKAINKAVEIVKKPSKATSDTIQKQRKAGGVNYQRSNGRDNNNTTQWTAASSYSVLDDFM
jgi:hypothetical protein